MISPALLSAATSLRDRAAFFQSEMMRPANDPKERDPAHVRMLNDVLRDLEKSFIGPQSAPGVYRWEEMSSIRKHTCNRQSKTTPTFTKPFIIMKFLKTNAAHFLEPRRIKNDSWKTED